MPKCPECNENITHLKCVSSTTRFYNYDGENYEDDDLDNFDRGTGFPSDDSFQCPECGEELFGTEDKAKEFLSQEDEEDDIVYKDYDDLSNDELRQLEERAEKEGVSPQSKVEWKTYYQNCIWAMGFTEEVEDDG